MKELTPEQKLLARTVMNNTYTLWGKKLASIPVDLMAVDLSYQRYVSSTLKKLKKEWDNNECRFLLVSYRDGRFYIIDGQHRYRVAKEKGIIELPCEIYTDLTREEEALIFSKQNKNVSKLTPYDTFKAKLASGMVDDIDVQLDITIASICDKHSITVTKGSKGRNLRAVTKARTLVNTYGSDVLDWIFKFYNKINWLDHNIVLNSTYITLFGKLYVDYKESINSMDKLSDYILNSNITPKDLISLANEKYPDLPQPSGLKLAVDEIIKSN